LRSECCAELVQQLLGRARAAKPKLAGSESFLSEQAHGAGERR
jgi:hypothetical protein